MNILMPTVKMKEYFDANSEDEQKLESDELSMSFRDKLVHGSAGVEAPIPVVNTDYEVHDDDIVAEDGKDGPMLTFFHRFREQINKPWKRTVIVKL